MSFEDYVAARLPALMRFAFVLCGDAHSAEDLVQTALMKAYRQWKRVCAADHPDAYVRPIIVTSHISGARRRRVREHLTDLLPDRASGGRLDDPADLVSERDELFRVLDTLPARQRAVLVMRHYAGYADADIAEALRCSEGTVRGYASRGLASLRTALTTPTTPVQNGSQQ